MNLRTFIDYHNFGTRFKIAATVTSARDNPHMDTSFPRYHYAVTLHLPEADMVLPFSTGQSWTRVPDVYDVMECLWHDAVTVQACVDFEDWAESLGFDTDSREAERRYNACLEQYDMLSKGLGNLMETFLNIEPE